METKVYITTKEECQSRIKGVCEGCGGPLEPIETVDNADRPTYWVGCMKCHHFRSGVEKKYWNVAEELVRRNELVPYHHLDRPDEKDKEKWEYYMQAQCAGLCFRLQAIEEMLNCGLYTE